MGDSIEEVNNRLKVLEVKKRNKIIVRIIAAILIVLVGILLVSNRVKGKIHVEIDDENYIVNNVDCRYTDFDIEEKLISFKTLRSVVFMHSGLRYGGYEYTFSIDNEEFNIQPKILIMKTNMWDASSANIDIRIVEDNGKWNAEVRVNNDEPKYFKDIEKNGIELQVGP